MPFCQFDTSALVKRYVDETGSAWVRALADANSGNIVSIADVTRAELASALTRRAREGSIAAERADELMRTFLAHCTTEYRLVPIERITVNRAIVLIRQHYLRAYDAIQLAVALAVNEAVVGQGLPPILFVSGDNDLTTAARAEGLATENPNHHPP
jgi:uncharacterized protein